MSTTKITEKNLDEKFLQTLYTKDKGIYNAEDVYKFVRAGKITSDEYYAIVGN